MITFLVVAAGLSLATGYALGVRRRPAHRAGRRYLGSIGGIALRDPYQPPTPARRVQHRPPAGAL